MRKVPRSMLRQLALLCVLFFTAATARADFRTIATTQPAPGITAAWLVRDLPPLHLYTVKIDLTDPAIHIRLCPADPTTPRPPGWQTCLLPVSAIARRENLVVAVNGSLF